MMIDLQKKDQGKYCICNESKKTYIEAIPQTKLFLKQSLTDLYDYMSNCTKI